MKILGKLLFLVGMAAFILGACGYDSNMVICGLTALVGLAIASIGYLLSEGYVNYGKEK